MGDLPGGTVNSSVTHLSRDGLEAAVISSSTPGAQAARWTQGSSLQGLGYLPDPTPIGDPLSRSLAISGDGRHIVGDSRVSGYLQPFVWNAVDRMDPLDPSNVVIDSGAAFDVSDDGNFAVGWGSKNGQRVAFHWSRFNGMRPLEDVLLDDGISVAGLSLRTASAISADGTFIAGTIRNTNGDDEAYLARIRLRGCNGADIAPPTGIISQADVNAFVDAFFANDPRVLELAEPREVGSQADITEFVRLFFAGCPAS
ncbi:MAG: hypothetical protein AAFR38_00615 [Planctomycetota bacterium]